MRRILLSAAVLAIAGSLTVAGEIGPPEPTETDPNMPLSFSLGYERSEAVFEPSSSSIRGIENLTGPTPIEIVGFSDTTVQQEKGYMQAGLNIENQFEVYGRIGVADVELSDHLQILEGQLSAGNFNDSTLKPYTTLGVKGLLYESETGAIGVGPFMQASYYSSYRDRINLEEVAGMDGVYFTTRWRHMWDINAGLAAQVKVDEAVIYGGPMLYYSGARVKHTYTEGDESISTRKNYREKGNVGSFIGARIPLPENMHVGVEGRYRSAFSMGVSLTKAF